MDPLSRLNQRIHTEENKGIFGFFKKTEPEVIIDEVYDAGKETVQKLQKKHLFSVKPIGSKLELEIDEALLQPKTIRKIIPKKIDKRTKKRIKQFSSSESRELNALRATPKDLNRQFSAIKRKQHTVATLDKKEFQKLVNDVTHLKKETKETIRYWVDQTGLTGKAYERKRENIVTLHKLLDQIKEERWNIQSRQPPLTSTHPFTNEEIQVVAHRMDRSSGNEVLLEDAVVPNAEESAELKSFYTVETPSSGHIGRHAVADTREKVDSLYAHLDSIEKTSQGPVRAIFCQLNAFEVGREEKMIKNQHLQMARMESRFQEEDRDVEVAHLNLSTNAFYEFTYALRRKLPTGLVDFFFPGEKKSALMNTPALVTYIKWLNEDNKISVEDNLYEDLLNLSDQIKQKCVKLESLLHNKGSKREIKTLQNEIGRLRSALQNKLKEGVQGNDIRSEGRLGGHFMALLKSQLGIEPISRGRELMIKNIMNERLGVHSFSNCKSGFDRTGLAFALELGMSQFSAQVDFLLRGKVTEADQARIQLEALDDSDTPLLKLVKLLTHYVHRTPNVEKPPKPYRTALKILQSSNGTPQERLFNALRATEEALQASPFSDSEKREILKQVVHLAPTIKNEYGALKRKGLEWIRVQAVDHLVTNWDRVSLKQNETEDVQALRVHIFKNLMELGLPIIFRGIGVLGLKWGKGSFAQLVPLRFIPSQIKVKTAQNAINTITIVEYDKTGNVKGLTQEGHRLLTRLSSHRGA